MKCNTMMWAIRVMPGVMTVTERHLQRNNFDGHLHTYTTAQFPNLLRLKCCKKQRVLMNYTTKFESFQFRALCTSDTLLIPTKSSVSITYLHLMSVSYMFRCLYTIIRENNYAGYLNNQLLL
jgi:hypothetical protein